MSQGKMWGVAFVLAALAGASLMLKKDQYGQAETDERVGKKVVAEQLLIKATSIAIKRGAEALELKKDPNGLWFVHGNQPFLAKANQVSELFQELLELRIQRRVGTKQSQLEDLQLDEKQATHLLITSDESSLSIRKGRQRVQGQGVYVAFANEKKSYVTDKNVRVLANPKMWLQRDLFRWKLESIVSLQVITLQQQKVDLQLVKQDKMWDVKAGGQVGDKVQESGISAFLQAITETSFRKNLQRSEVDTGVLFHHYKMAFVTGSVLDLRLYQKGLDGDKKRYFFQIEMNTPNGNYDAWLHKAGEYWVFEMSQQHFDALGKKISDFVVSSTPLNSTESSK